MQIRLSSPKLSWSFGARLAIRSVAQANVQPKRGTSAHVLPVLSNQQRRDKPRAPESVSHPRWTCSLFDQPKSDTAQFGLVPANLFFIGLYANNLRNWRPQNHV